MEKVKNKTNCPNCGAALPQFGGKCEFCGTRVIDLTAIDFDCADPTMFVLRMPKSISGFDGGHVLLSMWAKPELESVTMEADTTHCYNQYGEEIASYTASQQVAFEMTLRPYADPRNHSMFKLELDKEIKL